MARQKIKYQQVIVKVNGPAEIIPIELETDRLYKRVTGINVVSSGATSSKFSKLYMDIDSVEIFPRDFELLRILFRELVPFGFDYHELDEKAEGSRVKFEYRDIPPTPMPNPFPYPYTVVISLRLENDKPIEPNTTTNNPVKI
jgi:hypothetical protein